MVRVDEYEEGKFLICNENGQIELLIVGESAHLHNLKGDGLTNLAELFGKVTEIIKETTVREVYLFTEPTQEEQEIYEDKRLADLYSSRYGFEPLHMVRHRPVIMTNKEKE